MVQKRFRVGFSFAGEKRPFVANVARLLAERFDEAAILYDKFHESEFANPDLGFELPALYKEQTDLIVAVFCPDYEKKEWCGLEWRAVFSIVKEGGSKHVMTSRFGLADGKGLFGLSGFLDLDHKTPEEFADRILERLALNEGKQKDHYTRLAPSTASTPRISIPHNLPALQPFFGREEELRKIADALDPESRTWGALIDGPGGMGKTSLAVRAAYDASPEAFDRIVFVSLKARELDEDGVRDLSGFLISGLAELLNELAHRVGHAHIAKAADDQRPRLLLDAISGTRTLLVLDNLESLTKPERDVVFTFVKKLPSGCKAILTSRMRIGSAAEELILDKLSEPAALATLAKLAQSNPALAKTTEGDRLMLYHQTGGKPLLLRWTAGQIGRGSCLTLGDAIAYLRSCPEGNDPLEFIFGDLVEDFSEKETRVLCALAYFTLPAKVDHVAEIAESSEVDADKALRALVNRSLVVPSEELKTFALVPLVADFLLKKKPEVMAEAGARLEKRGYALAVEHGYRNYEHFPLLDAAWPTLAAALPRFLGGPNDQLQTLSHALDDFLDFTGRWDEWLALSSDAENRALAAADFFNAGWEAYRAGFVHLRRAQSTDALACADRAEQHWRRAQAGALEQAMALQLRGSGLVSAKDHFAAIAPLSEALDLWRTLGSETLHVVVGLNALANAKKFSGNVDSAKRDYQEALSISRTIDYLDGMATCTGNLAALALDCKDWPAAETLAREGLSLSENLRRQELIADNCCRLAMALVRQGKKAEACPYAQRAVDISASLAADDFARAREVLADCEA